MRKQYKQLYANKFNNVGEMTEFLETQSIKTDSRRNRKSKQTSNE